MLILAPIFLPIAVELGIAGVTVNLYDSTGTTLLATTTTDGSGHYEFDGEELGPLPNP